MDLLFITILKVALVWKVGSVFVKNCSYVYVYVYFFNTLFYSSRMKSKFLDL